MCIRDRAWGLSTATREELSIELFEYSIALYPDSPKSYRNYGYFLQHIDKPKQALEQFEESLKILDDEEVRRVRDELVKELKE